VYGYSPWYHDEVYEIVDADGVAIIETDSGCYGPQKADAEYIVEAVNNYPKEAPDVDYNE
jgi:hypothetical protein